MAVRVNASNGNYLYRTATLPTIGQQNAYTVCCWVYADALPGTTVIYWGVVTLDNTSSHWATLQLHRNSVSGPEEVCFAFQPGSGGVEGHDTTDLVTGQWYFVAGQYDPANNTIRVGRADQGDTALDYWAAGGAGAPYEGATVSASSLFVGSSGWNEYLNGRIAHVRLWNAALTQAEIEDELVSETAVRSNDLWSAWELLSDGSDSSGNNRPLSTQGSVTWVDGPPLTPPSTPTPLSHFRTARRWT